MKNADDVDTVILGDVMGRRGGLRMRVKGYCWVGTIMGDVLLWGLLGGV